MTKTAETHCFHLILLMTKMQMHFVLPLWFSFVVGSLLLIWLPILMFCFVSYCVCFVFLFFVICCCDFQFLVVVSLFLICLPIPMLWFFSFCRLDCWLICLLQFAGGCSLDPKANTKTGRRMNRIYFGCADAGGWWPDERQELQPSGKPRPASAEHMNAVFSILFIWFQICCCVVFLFASL